MDPLLEAISAQNNGYKWDKSGLQLEALCYADYNGLLTEDPKDMQKNHEAVNEFCRATGMKLSVKKSACYDIKSSAYRSYVINDFHPKWEVDGQKLPLIAPAENTKYLVVKVNSWSGVTKENLELWCSRIDKASLKPRQKLVMLNQYAIGRLQFYLSHVETPQCTLLEMDLNARRYAKQWLKLPECATDHILYAGTEKGGLSLCRLSLSVPCSRINVKRAVLNSSDESMRAFAVDTVLPEEIGTDADHFRIKVPANPKRGAKWRHLVANRWRKLKVSCKGPLATSVRTVG